MGSPFENVFKEVLTELTPEGGFGKEFSELDSNQRDIVNEMLGGGEKRDEYDALLMMGKAINQLNKVVGGFSSDDISIDYDAQTGQSRWKIRPKKAEEATGDADLGTADKEYMVYQRKKDDDDENPQYGFDYVRSVAATEE